MESMPVHRPASAPSGPGGLRLLELLLPLARACDLAAGFPLESSARAAVVAARLARAGGADAEGVRTALFATLLRYLGCSGAAPEAAALNDGDDRGFLQLFADADVGNPLEMAHRASRLAPRAPLRVRLGAWASLANPRTAEIINRSHCEVAAALSDLLRVGEAVTGALAQIYERFDGRGSPAALRGDAIALAARIMHIAQVVEVTARLGGADVARAAVRARAGGQLDPALAALFEAANAAVLDGLSAGAAERLVLGEEPAPQARVGPERRGDVAATLALVGDLKSTYTLGHSTGVAERAARCAGPFGLPSGQHEELRLAGLVHDIGRVVVANGVWERRGPLSALDQDAIRGHAWWTERILEPCGLFDGLIDLVGVHERLDGSGYHRRVRAIALPPAARLLAVVDVYEALRADRPWRPAMSASRAAEVLGEEARAGRLDPDAVRVVLQDAGGARPRLRPEHPAGLSDREVDLLALVARGRTNKEIAAQLHLAERTVKNHVARIFDRIGVRTRAAAALFAARHELHLGGTDAS